MNKKVVHIKNRNVRLFKKTWKNKTFVKLINTRANRLLIIFDDMVGSSLFSNKRDNFFKMMNANRRHKSLSMMMGIKY